MSDITLDSLDSLTGLTNGSPIIILNNDPLTGNKSSQETENRQILEVTGQGKVTVPTNLAEVELGIEVEKKTATEVQQEVAKLSTAVVEALEELDVQELQTTQIQLEPIFKFTNNNTQRIGFKGRNILQFQLPTDLTGKAIDRAVQAGANLIENISFIASDTELEEARLQAIRQAVQDAQIQANEIFKELQLIPGEIIKIDVIDTEIPSAKPLSLVSSDIRAYSATTPIIGGPQTIDATVSLDILYFSDSTSIF